MSRPWIANASSPPRRNCASPGMRANAIARTNTVSRNAHASARRVAPPRQPMPRRQRLPYPPPQRMRWRKRSRARKDTSQMAQMTRAEIREAFERWQQLDPEPKTELVYQSPFQLLVAVVLSAQSTDVGVNKATRTLFKVAPTPKKMVALGVDGVKSHIATLGLYNAKAANVVVLSQQLIDQHGG